MSEIVQLPVAARKVKKRSRWKVTDRAGRAFIAEGTSIATEQETLTIHVYDGSECILVVQEGALVEIMDDTRLARVPKPRKKRSTK